MKTKKKITKTSCDPITARHRYALLPEGSLIWPGYANTESGKRIALDFVLLPPNGSIHSIEEQGTGNILNYETLKPFNKKRAMFTKQTRMDIYSIYGKKNLS